MMSKIGNLFKKLLRKKKNSDDLDEVFHDEFDDIGEETVIFKDDNSDMPLKPHNTNADEQKTPATSHLKFPREEKQPDDATREIDLDSLTIDSQLEDLPEPSSDDEFDYTMGTDNGFTTEIDLDNSKISFKDRFEHFQTRVVDRFRNFNKKDLNQALKPPGQKEKTSSISVPIQKLKQKVYATKWDSLANDILKNSNKSQIHYKFQVAIVFVFLFILANIVSSFFNEQTDFTSSSVAPVIIDESSVISANDLNKINNSQIFKTDNLVADTGPKKQTIDTLSKCTKGDSKSSLPIKLMHTVVLQDSVKSIASVSIRSNSKLERLREGDKISTMAKIDRIERLNLVIKNLRTGNCESIPSSLDKQSKGARPNIGVLTPSASRNYKKQVKKVDGIENDGNNFTIKKDFLKEKISGDLSSLLSQARGIQINNPDGTLSFKIVEIAPDSLYANLNIQNGDIITQINGEPIESLNAITGLFSRITNLEKLNLTISRGGQPVTQNYNIK